MPAGKRGKTPKRKSTARSAQAPGRARKAAAKSPGAKSKKAKARSSTPKKAKRPLLVETPRVAAVQAGSSSAPPPRASNRAPDPDEELRDAPDYDETIENEEREKYMSVGEHLEEFRRRLLTIIAIVVTGSAIAGVFVQGLHAFLSQPYRDLTGRSLYLASVYGPLETLIKLALTIGVSLTLPLSFFVLWGFVTPALSRRGAIIGNASILTSSLLFWSGMVFCWYYLVPLSLKFMFSSILPAGTEPQITLEKYYSFFFLVHIGAGLAFQ